MSQQRSAPRRKGRSVGLWLQSLEDRTVPAGQAWSDLPAMPPSPSGATSYLDLRDLRPLAIDVATMRTELASAPPEQLVWFGQAAGLELALPRPDGTTARFAIADSPIMAPELAAQFPTIKTYAGAGIDDPGSTIRMDITPQGVHAMVRSPSSDTWYIDPYYHLEQSFYASYFSHDLIAPAGAGSSTEDIVDPSSGQSQGARGPGSGSDSSGTAARGGTAARSGQQLRTYRLAVAATGEYTQFQGGSVAAGQAAIVTSVNRLNEVYEQDLSIRMVLVPNNSNLVYTNPSTDPYTNNDTSALLDENQQNIDSVIGSPNYDIGHVYATEPGGLAWIESVGDSAVKAQGATGSTTPVGDAFWIDYVAHEMGHQFGANHTFNTSSDSQRNASTAYEPGSGSTIMAYAGITGPNSDLQDHSDPYFHSVSFDEIIAFVDNVIPTVGSRTSTGNTVPTVNAGNDLVIPARTPFELTAAGSDADNDQLTYSWEERDLGPANLLNSPDNGQSPLFRVFNPTSSPSRTFPKLDDIINNTITPGEKLYATSRTSHYRITVRDNRIGGGGVNTDDMTLSVVDTGSAFAVTAPNSGITWAGKTTQTVTWNVAGTTGNGINEANVRIRLSTDGGLTYPTTLFSSTPNDGTQTIVVPNVATTQARIRVEGVNSPFFDISNANFIITGIPGITVSPASGLTTTEAGGTATFSVVLDLQPTSNVTLSILSSDTTEGTVSTGSLTFNSADWSIPKFVTITGVDDVLRDGDIAYTIVTGAATSSDSRYSGLNPSDVAVVNINDDFSGFQVTPSTGLATTEQGGQSTFSVSLLSRPTNPVTIALSSSNTGEGTVSLTSLTFTSINWDTPRIVTVTGVNDSAVDGDTTYSIVLGAATSSDPAYSGLDPDDIPLTNRNDDTILTVAAAGSNLRYGQANPITATVLGLNGNPTTGTVTFFFGSQNLGTFPVINGVASMTTTVLPIGTNIIAASYTGDSFYLAGNGSGTVTILQALLNVTANPMNKVYGATLPPLLFSASGYVDGDNASIFSGALSTTATMASIVGQYPISIGSLTVGGKYEIAYTASSLTVTPAPLTIGATPLGKIYGAPVPALTFTPNGFVNGDTSAILTGSLTTAATAASPVGLYAIQKGSLSAGANYTINYLGASLAVTPAPLTITPNAVSKQYGPAPVPPITFTSSGFVNGDTASLLSGAPTSTATASSPVGQYPITVGSLTAGANYNLIVAPVNVSVTPAPLTVRANNATSRLGAPIPVLTYTASGFVNGDPSSVLSGVVVTTSATVDSVLGSYPITVSGGLAANYAIVPINGTITFTLSKQLVGDNRFTLGADRGGTDAITVYDSGGHAVRSFVPFPGFTGGVRTATGDINGDGVPDVAAGTGPGTVANVRVFDGATGEMLLDLLPFEEFTRGVFVSLGDMTGDQKCELVVTPDNGGGPRVSIFRGGDLERTHNFFGIDDANFRGGARTALGDINGDGYVDLCIAAGLGGGPRVSILDGRQLSRNVFGFMTADFFAFSDALRDGVYLASGDVDGDGFSDVIVGAGPGGAPRVLVLSGKTLIKEGANVATRKPLANFFSGDVQARNGVFVAARNLDNDAYSDVIVGGESLAIAYQGRSLCRGPLHQLYAIEEATGPTGGVYVG